MRDFLLSHAFQFVSGTVAMYAEFPRFGSMSTAFTNSEIQIAIPLVRPWDAGNSNNGEKNDDAALKNSHNL
ncbi:hypothetical protein WSM22_35040 [Cytophagales bacterium WSM2-2]|nr:hypothetical protein WSM22_35040 [Cytophagales bacterium WSM2-2]